MASYQNKALLRTFVETFPALKTALKINDCICYIVNSLFYCLLSLIKYLFELIFNSIAKFFALLVKHFPILDHRKTVRYERLNNKASRKQHDEPIPYQNEYLKRLLTYHLSLFLGAVLYIFVYYVLVKHSTYFTVAIGLLFLLAYLVILENSHNIRSIIMLCLPIMFTNRGRALVFCCMLAIMLSGPFKNGQKNIGELHSSINCCKQYSIIKADKYVDRNIMQSLVRIEDMINRLVENVKKFAQELEKRFEDLLHLALIVNRYMTIAIEKLKKVVNFCNAHSDEIYNNCLNTFKSAYKDCRTKLGAVDLLCEIVAPLQELCKVVRIPNVLCEIPREVIDVFNQTVGEQLRVSLKQMQNEFYFEVEVGHDYSYNGTKTKSFSKSIEEIGYDVEQKFWYVHIVSRVFNLVSLILVIWILITATLYQMHYLNELDYDNMYIDDYLKKIDHFRRERRMSSDIIEEEAADNASTSDRDESLSQQNSLPDSSVLDEDNESSSVDNVNIINEENKNLLLFPLPELQERKYPKPFSIWMNDEESHKLCIAGLIWTVIVGYIFFYVLVDFSLYKLIQLIQETLKDILFTSDLPVVDITSRSGDKEIRYNRTHLHRLRKELKEKFKPEKEPTSHRNGSLSGMYRKLMDSIEENIPDDVAILDSLELCLPRPSSPNFTSYENLAYLAAFTFGAVILEAYALRTRHCIANLFYPKRARKRAVWFYRKLLKERPKFLDPGNFEKEAGTKALEHGLKYLADRIKQ